LQPLPPAKGSAGDLPAMVELRVPRKGAEANQVKLFSFFEELAEPIKKVAQTAWASRGKLVRDIQAYVLLLGGLLCSMPSRASKVVYNPKLHALIAEEEDPEALAAVVFGLGGALCLGSMGAVVGSAVGGALGTALGVVPAFFTFGLSLPVGAVLGGVGGLCVGTAAAGSAGFVGGATSGSGVAYFRGEIRFAIIYVASKVYDVYDVLVVRPVTAVKTTTRRVRGAVHSSVDYTRGKALAVGEAISEAAADPCVQVSAAGAGIGAITLGTAGAASGAMLGGTAGMLVGLVPALFTFGLSVPIGVAVGGGAGLCMGGAAGTTVGFAGGGAMGCLGYKFRFVPGTALQFTREKARTAAAIAHLAPPGEEPAR